MKDFSKVPTIKKTRTLFDRSHNIKTTFNAGHLIPFYIDEVMPGQTTILTTTAFVRQTTPLHPHMSNIFLKSYYFYVPWRLVWDQIEEFYGFSSEAGKPAKEVLIPHHKPPKDGWKTGSFFDYAGIPVGVGNISVNALLYRAFQKIWNDWFRDQNLEDEIEIYTGSEDKEEEGKLLTKSKQHDYFTSSLPYPQKGDQVSIAIGQSALVKPLQIDVLGVKKNMSPTFESGGVNNMQYHDAPLYSRPIDTQWSSTDINRRTTAQTQMYWTNPNLYADLTTATSITISQLRQAITLQHFYEILARHGSRAKEFIDAMYGVDVPDYRLQRAEFLGFSQTIIAQKPVVNQSGLANGLGDLGTYAVGMFQNGFKKSFVEQGFVIGVMAITTELVYQYGLDRNLTKRSRYELELGVFNGLTDQAVLNKEIQAIKINRIYEVKTN